MYPRNIEGIAFVCACHKNLYFLSTGFPHQAIPQSPVILANTFAVEHLNVSSARITCSLGEAANGNLFLSQGRGSFLFGCCFFF